MKRPETEKILSMVTSAIGATAFSCLFVAVATDHWLYTLERRPAGPDGPIETVASHSGLWRICGQKNDMLDGAAFSRSACSYINYFSKLDRDGLSSTDTILLSLRRATMFPMISLVLSFSAQMLCLLIFCNCNPFRTTTTLVSSVLFITSGLILFVGIVIYIAAVTAEATNRAKSNGEEDVGVVTFAYSYGPSLTLAVASFFASEVSGVLAIHLFVSLRRQTKPDRPPPAAAAAAQETTLPPSGGPSMAAAATATVKTGGDGVFPGAASLRFEPFLRSSDPRSNPSNPSKADIVKSPSSPVDFSVRFTSV